jgi:hypothetical protein
MKAKVSLDEVYAPSQDLVARKIERELIIIPITSGIADAESEIFTVNETGQAVWEKLDGKRNLGEVVKILVSKFEASPAEIEKDVIGLVNTLLAKKMLKRVSR